MINIVIVDDDILVANALKTILEADKELRVVDIGVDGSDAVSLYRKCKPDVLLMDIRMKNMSGLDASEQILKEFPEARILLLTTFSDDEYIVKALKLGAKGYLLKQDYTSIIPAIRAVCTGQTPDFLRKIQAFITKIMTLAQENTRLLLWLPRDSATVKLQNISI